MPPSLGRRAPTHFSSPVGKTMGLGPISIGQDITARRSKGSLRRIRSDSQAATKISTLTCTTGPLTLLIYKASPLYNLILATVAAAHLNRLAALLAAMRPA